MPSNVGDTALVLLVPEADAFVHIWRLAHDPSAAEGMPAHITVLYPFAPESAINEDTHRRVREICANTRPLTVTFERIGRFPSVSWLDPASVDCEHLLQAVREGWPDYPPYRQQNVKAVPHLTVTDGADEETTLRAEEDVVRHLPLQVRIAALTLMAFDGSAWTRRREFDFASG